MRALTIRQPWAGAFFADRNPKDIENRSAATSYRGPVLIHAGQALAFGPKDATAMSTVEKLVGPVPAIGAPRSGAQWALGAVIGLAELVSVHNVDDCRRSCSPWALPARAHYRFENARLLRRPVQARGNVVLWTPDAELLREIKRIGFVR